MIQIDPNSMGLKLAQRQRFPSIPGRNWLWGSETASGCWEEKLWCWEKMGVISKLQPPRHQINNLAWSGLLVFFWGEWICISSATKNQTLPLIQDELDSWFGGGNRVRFKTLVKSTALEIPLGKFMSDRCHLPWLATVRIVAPRIRTSKIPMPRRSFKVFKKLMRPDASWKTCGLN